VVGGSGKTPLIIALAREFERAAVVLRGYGRESRGLVEVSREGEVLVGVEESGDEALLIARSLPRGSVLVSEDRREGVEAAVERGARVIFLDDGFHHCLEKLDILIGVDPPNPFCLPSGPFRLPRFLERYSDLVVREGRDFQRVVRIENRTERMVLLTAIARPNRLDPYLPPLQNRYTFRDHHNFRGEELERIWRRERPTSFLVTEKDLVKLERFDYPYSVLRLDLLLAPHLLKVVEEYIERGFHAEEATDCPDTP